MSAALHATATRSLRRLSFTFAPDGSHAACLAAGTDGRWYTESWRLDGAEPAHPTALPLPGGRSESLHSQLVSLPDGRVLLCRHERDRHDLVLLAADPDPDRRTIELPLATVQLPGLRLLPLPTAHTADAPPGRPVAIALGSEAGPVTTVWLITADGGQPRQVAEFPGLHGGGVWLDRAGRLLALDRVHAGAVKSVVLDLDHGSVTPLLEIAESSNDRLVLFDPDTRLLVLRSDAPGTDRLGWGVLGSPEPVRFPECLQLPGLFPRPVALEPGAPEAAQSRVAVQIDRGAASTLALWRPADGRLEPLPVPPGRLGAVGHWSAAGLRMPYSAPDRPAALATLDVDALLASAAGPAAGAVPLPLQFAPLGAGRGIGPQSPRTSPPPTVGRAGWRLDGSAPPADGGRWLPARSVELAGPAGPIESVLYGDEAWLSSPHLVVALHGGPADAWRLEFDPALQRLAAAGLAVLAPNQRGSTGYGLPHAMAVHGAWGGPDLADVLMLLDGLAGQRAALGLEAPALFGVSYGAFLALLTAAHAPADRISRCAVVAPFLSGARLLAEASPAVQALTTRLGGADPIDDERGPRDVLRLVHRLTAPLLMLHGDRDEAVPVGQSRALRHELLRQGRVEGVDFRYVEASGAGHELLAEEGSTALHELLAGFLRTGRVG
ncbi:S9 family peptidase [Kitasatospora mediocidica]|uniref:S9 family peptidase n=1 Tax=Kitasatospora mediocidica TaxID=58352 RepID=UPI0006897B6E|nr:alpha/beta fold hydrolase [Kitasatospora mediocidica]